MPKNSGAYLFLLVAAVLLALMGSRPAQAATLDTPWSGAGTGPSKVVSDGVSADPRFDYDYPAAVGTWTFSAVAGTTRSVPVKWDYSGLHAWAGVTVQLERFVSRAGADVAKEKLVAAGPVNCCAAPSNGFAYSGTSTFDVRAGDVYGFRMTGSNGDANRILRGSLKLQEVDGTPPAIEPVVTGQQGANGFYTGPVSVKWNIVDADSRIVERAGCDDVAVTEDTAGTTYTCSATSRGGATTQSVTIKRDTVAPELTLPPVLVSQATGATGAVLTYTATAIEGVVACSAPSGSTFPIGTTTVTCTATDAAGNATSKAFDAIVYPGRQAAPKPELKKINAVLSFRWTIKNGSTRLTALKVKDIPAGSTVTVSCAGKTCPKTLKGSGTTRLSTSSSVSLTTLVKGGFKSGTTIRVKVSSPGAETAVKTLLVRKGKAPIVR